MLWLSLMRISLPTMMSARWFLFVNGISYWAVVLQLMRSLSPRLRPADFFVLPKPLE